MRVAAFVLAVILIPCAVHAQSVTAPPAGAEAPAAGLRMATWNVPGPLTLLSRGSAEFSLPADISPSPSPPMMQYSRADWELGRAWLGAIIGTGFAYVADLVVHYESDFSKGNMFLDEKDNAGEVTYNILFYGGLAPYYSLKQLRSVRPLGGSSWGGFLGGVVGSLAGLYYWTDRGKVQDAPGIAVMTGLTALGTVIGYNFF